MQYQIENTMKKQVQLFLLLIFTACISSCGPTAEQKAAAEKAKADSIATATQKAVETRQALETQLDAMDNRLMTKKADLEVAKNQMNKIQEFQLLRTDYEREQQVHDQSIKIQTLEQEIAAAEQDIAVTRMQLNEVAQTLVRK